MGIVTPANNWTVGLSKSAAEGTTGTAATYEMPVFSGTPNPVQTTARIEVTDNASIVGDPYKQSGEHWEATVESPAFANALGAVLQSLWPTDTKAQAGTAITKTLTVATATGGTATYTAASHGFSNGDYIIVTGVTPATYNGIHVISNVATNTFDVTGFSSGFTTAGTAFGTAIRPPYSHAFSGLGSTQSWYALYSTAPGSMLQTFEDGISAGVSFSCDETGGPLRIQSRWVGKKPTKTSHTIGTTVALTDGFFTMTGGTIQYDEDASTYGAQTNVQKATINVDRPVTPLSTADGISVNFLGQGKVDPTFTATLLYSSWDAYQATYYGSASGTAPSSTMVYGSLRLQFVHSIQSTWGFQLSIPKAAFTVASPPQPDAGGGPLTVEVAGFAARPASGDHVVPVLCQNVSTAY